MAAAQAGALEIRATLVAAADAFLRPLDQAGAATEAFAKKAGDAVKSVGDKWDDFAKKTAKAGAVLSAAGAAITAPFALAGRDAARFGAGMANVATLGVQDLGKLGAGLQDLRAEFGLTTDGTEALYNTISAGVSEAAALGVLGAAAKGARAGVGELNTALDAGTSILNSYGRNVGTAADVTRAMEEVQGQLFTAIKFGKTTMDDLGGSIGRIAPLAAQAGISSEELIASIAGLTTTGATASEQVSALKAVIANVLKPSEDAATLAENLGIQFNATALASKGLNRFLRDVKASLEANGYSGGRLTSAMARLFGSVEGLNAVLALTGNVAGKVDEAMADMDDAVGNLNLAFEASQKADPSLVFQQLWASLLTLRETIGSVLLPLLVPFVEQATALLIAVRAFAVENPTLAATLVGLTVALGALVTVVGATALGLAAVAKTVGVLVVGVPKVVAGVKAAGVFLAGLNPVALAVAAAVALIAFNWEDFSKGAVIIAKWAWGWIVSLIAEALDTVGLILRTPYEVLKGVWQLITLDFDGALDTWSNIAEEWVNKFGGWIDGLKGAMASLWDTAKEVYAWIAGEAEKAPEGNVAVLRRAEQLAREGKHEEAKRHKAIYEASLKADAPIVATPMASGGIVTSAMLAIIGEGRGPEAVVPLDRLPDLMARMAPAGAGGAPVSIGEVHLHGVQDPDTFLRKMGDALRRRRGL